jgi:PucR family transcriptional regulator, purine catabolism regulatory protein
MLTVGSLAEEMGLDLVAGREAADAPVRWVHSTELLDPTPWLAGGELILTTGIQLRSAARQRELVRRLSQHHVAGLGFGTGFDHDELPKALVAEAEKLGFPVFEVPYELPFIAITEKAFTHLVNRQYEALQRASATHRRLERLLLDERGLDELVRAIATTIGGAAIVLSADGQLLASGAFARSVPDDAMGAVRRRLADGDGEDSAFTPDHPGIAGRSLALPILSRGGSDPRAWLVAVADAGGLGESERLILEQAATVVALELMRQRTMRETERRLAGDVLAEVLRGELDGSELAARLRPFGIEEPVAVLVFDPTDPAAAAITLDRALAAAGASGLAAARGPLLYAIAGAEGIDPVELAGAGRAALAESHGPCRAAASRPARIADLRRAFHEARCALEASALAANGEGPPDVASYRDLGAFQLLLALQDDESLRLYCDSVLGPLADGGGEYGDELVRSLEAFIESNGQWERAARALYCHRHTLRYRIRRIEQLTGRDLGRARDRIEFWLALRGRELVG